MFVPEYTITPKVLKNIALTEYSKGMIDSTVILPSWEKQLRHQTLIDNVTTGLNLEGVNVNPDNVKKILDNVEVESDTTKLIALTSEAFELSYKLGHDITENDLKEINTVLSGKPTYRSNLVDTKVVSEEILAETVELFDWLNSIDAKDTHPIVVAAVAFARLYAIWPFDKFALITTSIAVNKILNAANYSLKDAVSLSTYFNRGKKDFYKQLDRITSTTNDFTGWLEYFSEAFSMQAAVAQEKIKLLAKDTKLAKASGRVRLTSRQEKIVEYIQDYGILQNKDFGRLFPDKSEDSILRDLKKLVDKGIVQKYGNTKSSRYELS